MSTSLRPLIARRYSTRLRSLRDQTNTRARAVYAAIAVAEAGRRETVEVTPRTAAEWLRHPAVDQPPLDQAEVDRIAAQIRAGDWKPDPTDPIQLAPGERLLNGQHRLAAITASGVTVQALVAFDVIPDAIRATFDGLAPRLALYLEAGKGSAAANAAAFLNQLSLHEGGGSIDVTLPPPDVAKSGKSLAQAIRDYVVPAVLGAIAAGRPRDDAINYGAFLTEQFSDSETLRSADETIHGGIVNTSRFSGWEGILHPPTCDTCTAANPGTHGPDEEPYRHPGCDCEVVPIFVPFSYEVPGLAPA